MRYRRRCTRGAGPRRRAEGDPERRQPDISLAKKLLNWEPIIPLEEGLIKTIEYFKEELSKE